MNFAFGKIHSRLIPHSLFLGPNLKIKVNGSR